MNKLTKITLDSSSDSYELIFFNEKCFLEGDYYHEKVSEKWDGIKDYICISEQDVEFEELQFNPRDKNKELWELDIETNGRELNDYINGISENFSLV